MKKELLKAKVLLAAVMMAAATMFVACDKEEVDGGKNNQTSQPTNLRLERTGANLKVEWMAASGADRYEVTAFQVGTVDSEGNVTAYDEAEYVNYAAKSTEWSETNFTIEKGYNYMIQVVATTEGMGDSEPLTATTKYYVAAMMYENGDLVKQIADDIKDKSAEEELEIRLIAGAQYVINEPLDFAKHAATFVVKTVNEDGSYSDYKDGDSHPVITLGEFGTFRASDKGLTLNHLSVDCTAFKPKDYEQYNLPGIIEGSVSETLGAAGDIVFMEAVNVNDCYFKNVPGCFFSVGNAAFTWAPKAVNVTNSIIQLDNDGGNWGDASVFSAYASNWTSGIKDIKITNSTIYNVKGNNHKNRFVRFARNTLNNAFGAKDGSFVMENCTVVKTFTSKEFGNTTPNMAEYAVTFNKNVLVDVYRINKFAQGNNTRTFTNNICWRLGIYEQDSSDTINGAGELENDEINIVNLDGSNKIADPGFGDTVTPLDFNAENGYGNINLKSVEGQGDPRWN